MKEVLQDSARFLKINVVGLPVGSDVSDQLVSLQEIFKDRKTMQEMLLKDCDCKYDLAIIY